MWAYDLAMGVGREVIITSVLEWTSDLPEACGCYVMAWILDLIEGV